MQPRPKIELTTEQQAIADAVVSMDRDVTIGGLAGTGKTVLCAHLAENIPGAVVVAPSGKAAQVLRNKGIAAETIHSVFYQFTGVSDKLTTTGKVTGRFTPHFTEKNQLIGPRRIIVDEASMVSEDLYQEITKHGVPVVWIGDHGQLPPVGKDPGLMRDPDHVLRTIHRQAKDSPIIQFAYKIREGGPMVAPEGSSDVAVYGNGTAARITGYAIKYGADQIMCGYNSTRHAINREYRAAIGRLEPLEVGDRVICLRNSRDDGIYNGMIFNVTEIFDIHGDLAEVEVEDDWTNVTVRLTLYMPQFGGGAFSIHSVPRGAQLFDYAYCITVHKSQGSEWPHVVVIDEASPRLWDQTRWRYTAVTRAKNKVTVMRGCSR